MHPATIRRQHKGSGVMAEGGSGWMTTLADLSIILFMITAADLSQARPTVSSAASAAPALAEPVATFRQGSGMPSLARWLADQPVDPRQRLTVLVRHDDAQADHAVRSGLALMRQAEEAGRPARLIVERAAMPDTIAYLAYDAAPVAAQEDTP